MRKTKQKKNVWCIQSQGMQTISIGREKASFEKGKVYGNNKKLKIIYVCMYIIYIYINGLYLKIYIRKIYHHL